MADERQTIMRLLTQQDKRLLRRENSVARAIIDAYENARASLIGVLAERYAALGENPDPAAIRRLASDASLIRAIDARLAELYRTYANQLRSTLLDVVDDASESVLDEVEQVARLLNMPFIRFAVDELLELTVVPAIEQVPGIVDALKQSIINELRTGLAQGQRFTELRSRVFAQADSVFARGKTSAELMVRRAVIQANNNARLIYIQESNEQVPGLKKQAVAAIQGNTTKTCLRVHGQIQDADKPFELKAEPRFDRKMMTPPFHWNCRTSVVPYHPRFEETSSLTTADMRAEAQAELAKR